VRAGGDAGSQGWEVGMREGAGTMYKSAPGMGCCVLRGGVGPGGGGD